jgi:osmotically inducible protein OsmC
MLTTKSDSIWNGDLKSGNGTMNLGSGICSVEYSFASRFEGNNHTNPEELLGAAHAGCYSMALSNELAQAGFTPNSVKTSAEVTFGVTDDGPMITSIALSTVAEVPDIEEETFMKYANGAKEHCPVSKALAGTEIKLISAELVAAKVS